MKKIILKESQYKLYEEMKQYTTHGNEVKDFNSNINLMNIDFQGHENDLEIHDSSNILVDWSTLFMFTEKGFNIKIKINRVYGKVNIASWEQKKVVKEVNIDTSNGWNLDTQLYVDESMNSDDFYLDIDFSSKSIVIK